MNHIIHLSVHVSKDRSVSTQLRKSRFIFVVRLASYSLLPDNLLGAMGHIGITLSVFPSLCLYCLWICQYMCLSEIWLDNVF